MRYAVVSFAAIALFLAVSGLIWSAKDGEPGEAARRLAQPPDRLIEDPRTNGYFMMVGFAASADADPVETGLAIWRESEAEGGSRLFNYRKPGRAELRTTLDTDEACPAWISADPLSGFRNRDALGRLPTDPFRTLLGRYERFLGMPFEDWGFGHRDVLRLDELLIVHRLYVATGYAHSPQLGWARLQRDIQAWRLVSAEARTIALKTGALLILEDDLALLAKVAPGAPMASGADLLSSIHRFTKDDYSLRWPIRNEFALGTARGHAGLLGLVAGTDETARNEGWLARKARLVPDAFRRVQHPPMATMFQAKVQPWGIWDTYAMYYDLAIMASETLHSPLPRLRDVARLSPRTLVEILFSPMEFEPDWQQFSLRLMETDARLRLASLQLLLRRPRSSVTVSNRLAELGPQYYDPFTGLPMLWSERRAVVYSVGRDRIDDGGDPYFDLVVPVTAEGVKPSAARTLLQMDGAAPAQRIN
ncbi:MAG TPA: hypothetical protein VHF07_00435 [Nitrospiraceae bacterium]|nr:hypothetical protein [Nitrospiraceae bacterium]